MKALGCWLPGSLPRPEGKGWLSSLKEVSILFLTSHPHICHLIYMHINNDRSSSALVYIAPFISTSKRQLPIQLHWSLCPLPRCRGERYHWLHFMTKKLRCWEAEQFAEEQWKSFQSILRGVAANFSVLLLLRDKRTISFINYCSLRLHTKIYKIEMGLFITPLTEGNKISIL